MMIGVRVHRIAALSVPVRDLFPGLAAVLGAMQIDATADHMIGIRRMDDDRIAVRDLSFALEVIPLNILPTVAAIRAAKDSEQQVFVAGGLVLRKRVKHLGFRRTDRHARPSKQWRVGTTGG